MAKRFTSIGDAAKSAGCRVATIRYYEDIGLMPKAERGAGGQRVYDETDVARLTFIRRCRDLDMPIEKITALLAISDDGTRPCVEALDLTNEHLSAVRSRMAELRKLERTLAAFAADCASTCCMGAASTCTLFSELRAVDEGSGPARRVRRDAVRRG
jgi:DNA-binding transcriptional MerR regulator